MITLIKYIVCILITWCLSLVYFQATKDVSFNEIEVSNEVKLKPSSELVKRNLPVKIEPVISLPSIPIDTSQKEKQQKISSTNFQWSIFNLLRNHDKAIRLSELSNELKLMVKAHKRDNIPLPSEGSILNRIREVIGDKSFTLLNATITSAPVVNEAEFTRSLYRSSILVNGKRKLLVLKNINELAIWFIPRQVAREWGYLQ